jgi:DNA repair protein RecN (Recombination protein N)
MLKQLTVSNYILIEDIKISFREGLTIITGETGAGKSIFLGALRLIMGERIETKVFRNEDKKCVIEALFNLSQLNLHSFFSENDLDYEEETIIRREIMPNGKSRIFINDSPVTLHLAQELTHKLLDIHSQFSNNQLRDPHFHLQIIDALVQDKSMFTNYSEKFKRYKKLEKKLHKLLENQSNQNQTKEYNAFLLDELLKSNLKEKEWVELENEQKLLSNATEILTALDKSVFLFDNEQTGVINNLTEILQNIHKISSENTQIQEIKERINSVKIELHDILHEINVFSTKVEVNPNKLDQINQRIDLIYQLQTKHKVLTIKELLDIQTELEKSI